MIPYLWGVVSGVVLVYVWRSYRVLVIEHEEPNRADINRRLREVARHEDHT